MVAASRPACTAAVTRVERLRYLTIVTMVRGVVSPRAPVWTIAVIEHWPAVAPFGIVVVNDPRPSAPVDRTDDAIAGTPGTASVNVTFAPGNGAPSGSVTLTVSVTGSGNCESLTLKKDAVTFADASLRGEIAARHPELAARFTARRNFVSEQLGVTIRDDVLLLSAIPLCLPPFWLDSSRLLTLE